MYLRSVFCNHDFEYSEHFTEQTVTIDTWITETKKGEIVHRYCKKCGYHETYWKFL